jgi:CubicO group peptidase (beta-lactamase class C family)
VNVDAVSSVSRRDGPVRLGIVVLLLIGLSAGIVHRPEGASRAGASAGPVGEMDLEAFLRHLDRHIPEWMARESVPGVTILLVHGGAPVWREAYGWADLGTRRPLEPETPMMTQSISKSLTAWGVMRLVEEGRIGLDDPVRRHLPSWDPGSEGGRADRVTVRQLLSNSSGLPLGTLGIHFAPGEEVPPLPETLADPASRLAREPGTTFEYSNVGFGVLEWLIESVTGRDFGEFMEEEVLLPLGMDDSSFDWDEGRHGALPLGYDLRGDPVEPYLYPNRASGGLFSTADDLGRFVAAGIVGMSDGTAPRLLSSGSLDEMYTPQIRLSGIFTLVSSSYGLGHFLEELPGGQRAVWHGGQGLGWMTHFHAVPATGDGIVILTNSQRSWPLMAAILRDWGEWRGFGPIGMGRIAQAGTAMKGVVGLILLLAGWRGWRLYTRARARWGRAPGEGRRGDGTRVLEFGLGLSLLGLLLWAVTRDYLFLTSVFPTTAVWLGWSLTLLAAVMVAGSLLSFLSDRMPPRPLGAPSLVLAVAFLSGCLGGARAHSGPDAPAPDEPPAERIILPFLLYAPETKLGGGVVAGGYRRMEPELPTSSLLGAVTVTARRQLLVEAVSELHRPGGGFYVTIGEAY